MEGNKNGLEDLEASSGQQVENMDTSEPGDETNTNKLDGNTNNTDGKKIKVLKICNVKEKWPLFEVEKDKIIVVDSVDKWTEASEILSAHMNGVKVMLCI